MKFLSSLQDDLWFAEEDVIGTEAHNIMLFEQGILNKEEISKILSSLEKVKKKIEKNELELDSSFEDIHPLIEKMVIDDIGIEIGGKIHTGRSRNDQVSVDIRLKIRNEINELTEKLFEFIIILQKLAEETKDYFIPLYTHLQKGQLGVFAHYLNGYCSQILRSIERLNDCYKRINLNPLGACAIGGTNFNIDRERTTHLLGFDGVIENSIDAISSKDFMVETIMNLSLLALQLSRITEDLVLWSSKEFEYLELDDGYASVSSVMPQKKNPDTIEIARAKSSKIISNLIEIQMICKAIPTGYFRDFQQLKMPIKDSFDVLNSIIEILSGVFSTIKLKKENMRKAAEDSLILSLDLAELLVIEYNIPFRQSHKIVGNLIKDNESKEGVFDKSNIEKAILQVTNHKVEIDEKFMELFKNLEECLKKRVSMGSPSLIDEQIGNLKAKQKVLTNQFQERKERISKAEQLRIDLVKKYLKL